MIINMNGAKAPETPSPTLQEKTVTPETLPTVIGADEGYDGLSQVTVNPDSQLIPTNIRSGKTIFGVEGSFVGEPQPSDYTASDIVVYPSISAYYGSIGTKTNSIDVSKNVFEDGQYECYSKNFRQFAFIGVGNEAFATSTLVSKSATATQKTTVTVPEFTPNISILIYFPSYSDYGWWDLPLNTIVNISASVKKLIGLAEKTHNAPTFYTIEDLGVFNATTSVSGLDTSRKIAFNIDTQPEHTATAYRKSTSDVYFKENYIVDRLVIKVIS